MCGVGLWAAHRPGEVHSLMPTLKVGNRFVYEMKSTSKVGERGSEFNATFEMNVTAIDPDLLSFRNLQKNGEYRLGDQVRKLPESVTTSKLKKNGEIMSMDPPYASAEQARFSRLMMFVVPAEPVKVGHVWSWTTAGNETNAKVGATSKAKCLGFEDHMGTRCAHVEVAIEETSGEKPAKGSMELWVALKDGLSMETKMEFENTPVAPGLAASYRGTILRISGPQTG